MNPHPWRARLAPPGRFEAVRGSIVVRSDVPLGPKEDLVEEIALRREDLARQLGLPPSQEPIEIYLFHNAEALQEYLRLHFPGLPNRRAYFIKTETRLAVYAEDGPRLAEDLRHESVHAYLHAVVPRLPLWLDEGLAEYYECPRGSQGINREHLIWLQEHLRDGQWQPDLVRLEKLPTDADLNRADYAEAWAWVHLLLQTHGPYRQALREYVSQLRTQTPPPLSAQLSALMSDPPAELTAHVHRTGTSSTDL